MPKGTAFAPGCPGHRRPTGHGAGPGRGAAAEAAPTGAEHGFGRRAWIRARVRARDTCPARGRDARRRSGAWPRPAMPKGTAFAPGHPEHRRPTGPGAGPGVAAEAAPTRVRARVLARGMGSGARHGAAACAVGAALGRDRRCQRHRLRLGLPRTSTPHRPRRRAGPGQGSRLKPLLRMRGMGSGARHGAAACAVGAALGRDRRCQGRRLRPGLPRASTPDRPRRPPPRPRRRAGGLRPTAVGPPHTPRQSRR